MTLVSLILGYVVGSVVTTAVFLGCMMRADAARLQERIDRLRRPDDPGPGVNYTRGRGVLKSYSTHEPQEYRHTHSFDGSAWHQERKRPDRSDPFRGPERG